MIETGVITGRIIDGGYYKIKIRDYTPSLGRRYYLEHRYIMEQHLGRYLTKNEIIHHLNGDKLDNRIENIQIVSRQLHPVIHYKLDVSDRICKLCGSNKTVSTLDGRNRWYIHEDGFKCHRCYDKSRYSYVRTTPLEPVEGRICVTCGSGYTYVDKRGWRKWYRYNGGWDCVKCYKKRTRCKDQRRRLGHDY